MIKDYINKKEYKNSETFKYYNDEYFEHFSNDGTDEKAKKLKKLIYKPFSSVIDIGCGDAKFLNEFINGFKKPLKVVGTDISMKLLKKAEKNNSKIKYYRCDSKKLPFKDKEFDIAILADVLEHLENPEKTLKEVNRIARLILIKVPLEDNLFQNIYKAFFTVNWKQIQGHINFWNSSTFERFINKNDLIIIGKYIPRSKMTKQPNWKLQIMNLWQNMVDFLPISIKTKLAPSEYYCIVR